MVRKRKIARKSKVEIFESTDDEDDEDILDEDEYIEDDEEYEQYTKIEPIEAEKIDKHESFNDDIDETQTFYGDDGAVSNSLQLAAMISKPSKVLDSFSQITKEQRNAFFDETQVRELRHRHKCYINFMYIRKILKLQKKEDEVALTNRRKVFDVKTAEQLREYFLANNKSYLYSQLTKEYDIEVLLNDIKNIDRDCIDEDIYQITQNVNQIFEDYSLESNKPEYIDDLGNLATMQSESILSAGKGGNERYAGITSIGATRDIDMKEKVKKETEYNSFGKFFKRFTK